MSSAAPRKSGLPSPGLVHRCPVCNSLHAVSAARAEMAYGRQLCCSPDCEGERRRRSLGHPYRIIAA
jgi:hypothetical protein